VDIYGVDLLRGGDVGRDDGYRAVTNDPNSFQAKVRRGRIDGQAGKVSRRDRRAVTESSTIISAWGDAIDIMIRTRREAVKRGCGGDGTGVVGDFIQRHDKGAYTTDPLRALKI
jgi:hypothetical protein